ncbi:alpha/beta hydrolase [Lentzea sp. NBRC 102530]|uniref:alpha/beta hydrolase n=1 Tax=Lentzea sp. NBRC 102530 TaxID=3032201 RepID=UPI0024A55A8B|nr:alpha/beta hydrolase [Lentzea sp. NBRC 102530]GLY54382.1 peptidase [Lentzea sp. NBRC 102530]
MRRRTIAVALAVATATSLLIAPQASAAQQIQWQQCFEPGTPGLPPGGERLECGSFTAPMNWNNPRNGKTITIAVSRLKPRNGTAKQTIFTNPGGPGAPGVTLPLVYLDRPKLSDNAEIIGIDVRGTGASSNVTCDGFDAEGVTDPRDRGRANLDLLYGSMKKQAELCQARSGEFGRFVTTDQTVKDLDLLRQLLGKRKVSWLGYSGGSWVGAYYATYFPKTLDKIVLDSNVEFTAPWQDSFDDWGMGFERRFRTDFLPWVAKYDSTYHLGKTAEEVRQSYERARVKLNKEPVTRPEGVYNGVQLDLLLRAVMYRSKDFPLGAQIFAELAGATPALLKAQAGYPDAANATAYSLFCNDTKFRGGREFLERESAANGAKWPLVGYYQVMGPCAFWDRPNVHLKHPNGIGAPKTLMVQSVRDPATPLEGAQRAHQRFTNSVLLTVENEGDHGIYGVGSNSCVNDVVESYFIDGVTPAKDLTCQGVPLPVPGEVAPNPAENARQLAAHIRR